MTNPAKDSSKAISECRQRLQIQKIDSMIVSSELHIAEKIYF